MTEAIPVEKSQEELVKEYLAGHAEYKRLVGQALGMYNAANSMEQEAAPQDMVDQQRADAKVVSEEADVVMRRYAAIGEQLTQETKDKYLKLEQPMALEG